MHDDTVIDLEIDGEIITTTEDHPFWNNTDQEWQRADELDPGDQLLTADGRTLLVGGLDLATSRTDTAYNLEIADTHTYHVGDSAILVHNENRCEAYRPKGAAADFDLDELAELTFQHVGAGDLPGRPTLQQIRNVLDSVPEAIRGQNAVRFESKGVRVIINEDMPWRSTAYFTSK